VVWQPGDLQGLAGALAQRGVCNVS
jgi:hypothetical protein